MERVNKRKASAVCANPIEHIDSLGSIDLHAK